MIGLGFLEILILLAVAVGWFAFTRRGAARHGSGVGWLLALVALVAVGVLVMFGAAIFSYRSVEAQRAVAIDMEQRAMEQEKHAQLRVRSGDSVEITADDVPVGMAPPQTGSSRASSQPIPSTSTPSKQTTPATTAPQPSTEEATETKPAPTTTPAKPPTNDERPAWVDQGDGSEGDGYRKIITVGPYSTRSECEAQLPGAVAAAVWGYAERLLGDGQLPWLRLPVGDLQPEVVRDTWLERIDSATVGPMVQLHVRLVFDAKLRERFRELHRQAVLARRLEHLTFGAGGVLLALGGALVILRVGGRGAVA